QSILDFMAFEEFEKPMHHRQAFAKKLIFSGMEKVIPKRTDPGHHKIREAMMRLIARRMRMKRSVGGLTSGHQADTALENRNISKRISGDARLHTRIAPPHGLLPPRAIHEGIEQAVALRLASHAPNLIQFLVTAFECADIFNS